MSSKTSILKEKQLRRHRHMRRRHCEGGGPCRSDAATNQGMPRTGQPLGARERQGTGAPSGPPEGTILSTLVF